MTHSISDVCVGCGACLRVCPVDAIEGLPKQLHIIDPDICIDCGACGIVCPVSCISDQKGVLYQFLKPRQRPRAVVHPESCSGCQYCISICPFDCLELQVKPGEAFATATSMVVRPNKCTACRLCIDVCPRETIELEYPAQGGDKIA